MPAERNILRMLAAGLTGLLLVALPANAEGQDANIEDFFGAYVGDAMIEGTMQFRDIIVGIEPIRNGFSIYTSTVIRTGPERATKGVKWRSETQSFVKTDTPHVYEPMVRKSMFSEKRDPSRP